MNIGDILPRLEKVKRYNRESWVACCPAHDDKSPSLAIKVGDHVPIVLHCFAGCSVDAVVAALGLTMDDLMDEAPAYHANHKRSNRIPSGAILKAMAFDALRVGLYASRMAQGYNLTEDDKTALLLISGAFQEAIDYTEG